MTKDPRSNLAQVEDGWIELYDGTAFFFENPTNEMIQVDTIARVLSRICRYNGHTTRHYSVAEHCILLADYVSNQEWSTPRDILTILHHDDAEYIMGDLTRPIKAKVPEFKALEEVLDQAFARKFNTIWPFPNWLTEYDARILKDERANVINPSNNNWGIDDLDPLNVNFHIFAGESPEFVAEMFLERHHYWTDIMELRANCP